MDNALFKMQRLQIIPDISFSSGRPFPSKNRSHNIKISSSKLQFQLCRNTKYFLKILGLQAVLSLLQVVLAVFTCKKRKIEACMLCSQYVYRLSYVDITFGTDKSIRGANGSSQEQPQKAKQPAVRGNGTVTNASAICRRCRYLTTTAV